MEIEEVCKGVLPSIGAALLLVSLGGARFTALAVAAGLFAAYALLRQVPASPLALWREPDFREWLLWAVAGACALTLLEHLRVLRGVAAGAMAGLLGAVSTWLVLGKVARQWEGLEFALHMVVSGVAVVSLAGGCRWLLRSVRPGPLPAVLVVVVLSFDAWLLGVPGRSALLAQLAGAIAAAAGAAVGTALWRRPFALAVADGTWLGIAHGLLLVAGAHLTDLPWAWAAAGAFGPAVLLVAWRRQRGQR